jgi:dienelactone hydrolase
MSISDSTIEQFTEDRTAHYEPYGWHHWPAHPWMAYQFRRALGETQEGGGAVSECFQAASRMVPGDRESWHREWLAVAERNDRRGNEAEATGHVHTAKACWLRSVDYYRSAEFWLGADDPRRLEVFTKCEAAFQKAGRYFTPPVERVEVAYEDGQHLSAYFIKAPAGDPRQPVLIGFGGLDSFKEELLFMVGNGALSRGISCLLVDGPGQGATLRRLRIPTRVDYEVPVARCIDYLETRSDVDMTRIAVSGSSLGGYYAARAGAFEHRLAAVVSHGAIWNLVEFWQGWGEDHALAGHIKWVFGTETMADALGKCQNFKLEGVIENIQCPYLILHGGHDVLGVRQAEQTYEYARAHGVAVTLKLVSEDETGAEHCQHDNPTLGMEHMADWLTEVFHIDERRTVLSQTGRA